jgi:hypothetical protein
MYFKSIFANKKLTNELNFSAVEKAALIMRIEELMSVDDAQKIENTDGFLKFVSDSRDWAFKYIEDVQEALRKYDDALHTDDAKIINEAYSKLIDFLPKDDVVK